MQHTNKIRGGRGSKGIPSEIQNVLVGLVAPKGPVRHDSAQAASKGLTRHDSAQAAPKRLTRHDSAESKMDKNELFVDLEHLRTKEKQAQDENLSSATKNHIADAINHVQKKLAELGHVLADVHPSIDHTIIPEDPFSKLVANKDADLARIVPIDFPQTDRVEKIVPEFSLKKPSHEETPETDVVHTYTPVIAGHTSEAIPEEIKHEAVPPRKNKILGFSGTQAKTGPDNFFYTIDQEILSIWAFLKKHW